jgi:predicted XRE-type DNA-binding protein
MESGKEGTVHSEQVLEYNQDPHYLRDALLYKLTVEAQKRVEATALSKREIIRRLGTSATQFYRLLDQTNYRKSVDQLLSLLHVLDCDIDLLVRTKTSSGKAPNVRQRTRLSALLGSRPNETFQRNLEFAVKSADHFQLGFNV